MFVFLVEFSQKALSYQGISGTKILRLVAVGQFYYSSVDKNGQGSKFLGIFLRRWKDFKVNFIKFLRRLIKNEIIPDIVAIVKIFETVALVHSSRLVVVGLQLLPPLPLLILLVDDWLSLLIDDWLDYYDLRLLIGWIEGLI